VTEQPARRPRAPARAALLIAEKDLKARIRDRSALIFGILVPLGLAFIFNAIFGGVSGNSLAISLGVAVSDHGPVSQAFVRQVLDPLQRSGLLVLHTEPSAAAARSLTANGTLRAAIVIPSGFSGAVLANQPASMTVIENASAPVTAQIVHAIAEGYTADLNRIRLSVRTVAANSPGGLSPARIGQLAARAAAAEVPVAIRDISASTK